jgi:hypothetical protein
MGIGIARMVHLGQIRQTFTAKRPENRDHVRLTCQTHDSDRTRLDNRILTPPTRPNNRAAPHALRQRERSTRGCC